MTNTPNYGIIHALKTEPTYFGDIIDGKKHLKSGKMTGTSRLATIWR